MGVQSGSRRVATIRWTTAFIDRPMARFGQAADFWTQLTDTTLSGRRGDNGQFATLLPSQGDACIRLQGVGGGGGAHLDFEVDDTDAMVDHATRLGAEVWATDDDELVVLQSPAGLRFCVMPWDGAANRPQVVSHADGSRSRLDQVCLDLAPSVHAADVAFWTALTGWEHRTGRLPEFGWLCPPRESGLPVQILFQRTDDEQPARAHLDVACSDIDRVRVLHEHRGARQVWRGSHWVVMRDPADGLYCLTARDPDTSRLPSQ